MNKGKMLACAACFALTPGFASAGGFDLTGQPIGIIFEEGNYIEGQAGLVIPTVEGSNPAGGAFGNTGNRFPFFTGGVKVDFTDRISGALILDTPYQRSTTYERGLFVGTSADVDSKSLTAVGRFKINDNFSVYGGPRFQNASVDLQGPAALPGFPFYQLDLSDNAVGFVAGASFEIPKYKVRAAVTYNSQINHGSAVTESFTTPLGTQVSEGSVDIETPQSVNIDLQAPISRSTLVKANIRWVEWGGINLTPPLFLAATGNPVVVYTEDTITYRLTVAQKLTDNLAGFVTGSYEEEGGEDISLFKTVDGGFSLGGGLVYENDEGFNIQLAGEYRWLNGDSGVQAPGTPPSDFDEANAVALSVKVGYRF